MIKKIIIDTEVKCFGISKARENECMGAFIQDLSGVDRRHTGRVIWDVCMEQVRRE